MDSYADLQSMAVIGVLLIATVATLFFVPVVYSFVRRNGYADVFPNDTSHAGPNIILRAPY